MSVLCAASLPCIRKRNAEGAEDRRVGGWILGGPVQGEGARYDMAVRLFTNIPRLGSPESVTSGCLDLCLIFNRHRSEQTHKAVSPCPGVSSSCFTGLLVCLL